MKYLLDTNVVSESRKTSPDPQVRAWFASTSSGSLYLSALVIGELRFGIERLHHRAPDRAQELTAWLDTLIATFRDRTLDIDVEVADWWGRLNAAHGPLAPIDGLLAATAHVHGLTVATRNVAHFARTGVPVVDPWSDQAS